MATAADDEDLGYGPSEDSEVDQRYRDLSDGGSILSDDSVLPDYEREVKEGIPPAETLYEACRRNQGWALRRILERGVTKEDVNELDINRRNGFMVAIAGGFLDIVYTFHGVPHLDINHQDKEGYTALMIASQAGFVNILNYLMNYFPGVNTELRDSRGFTALIKAAMQGRDDCVSALLMHGADVTVVDSRQERGVRDWALKTGRFDTLKRLRRLHTTPTALQFSPAYRPEWPQLRELVAKAARPRTLATRLRDTLTFSFPGDPVDDGVMDHMVRMTTGFRSPLVAMGTHPLCPSSPPQLGKHRMTVPELTAKHGVKALEETEVRHSDGSPCCCDHFLPAEGSTGRVYMPACCRGAAMLVVGGGEQGARRESVFSVASDKVKEVLPRSLAYRNSIFPANMVPKITIAKSGALPKKAKEKKQKEGYLELPIWKYKEAKLERKREKQRLEDEKAGKTGKKDKKEKKAKKEKKSKKSKKSKK